MKNQKRFFGFYLSIFFFNFQIMKKNMGTLDKVVRFFFVLIIAALYGIGAISGTLAIILGAVALYLILTSAVGVCPVYLIPGWNTIEKTVDGGRKRSRGRRR